MFQVLTCNKLHFSLKSHFSQVFFASFPDTNQLHGLPRSRRLAASEINPAGPKYNKMKN